MGGGGSTIFQRRCRGVTDETYEEKKASIGPEQTLYSQRLGELQSLESDYSSLQSSVIAEQQALGAEIQELQATLAYHVALDSTTRGTYNELTREFNALKERLFELASQLKDVSDLHARIDALLDEIAGLKAKEHTALVDLEVINASLASSEMRIKEAIL